MATLVLQTLGAAIGGAVAGPIGAAVGQVAGALAGAAIGGNSPAQSPRIIVGPKLTTLNGIASSEGAPIPRVFGRARIGGQLIWATRFLESTNIGFTPSRGGKSSGPAFIPQIEVTTTYSANFAVGLCEGPISFVRRIWADGKELDIKDMTIRVYTGSEDQEPDPLIAAKEAPGSVPAYRGLAYVVFEQFQLARFGNRIPQLTFEVVRCVNGIGSLIRAVDIIPGASEFGYQPALHISLPGPGVSVAENRNQHFAETDWHGSLDALQALCPNLESVALIVVWFGDDLRAGHCTIAPRVDYPFKTLSFPYTPVFVADWSVAGLPRGSAQLVSQANGKAAFGGSPSDDAVIAAIRDLKSRGLSVTLYPFIMMDIAANNALPDPWSGSNAQPAYPWRGRIVCDPAPERSGSPDGTSAAANQIAAFFGSQNPSSSEWSYRRFILHCADLAVTADGVDAFLIGSELVALTRGRSRQNIYPAADALAALAADVRAKLGTGTQISYAADWTEYGAHVRNNGADVGFPLDAVWSSSAVDFIGLDVYWPLSDWRDGDHLDQAEVASIYDAAYLSRRMASGEDFDWYYTDKAARENQTRTPITDNAFGKPWVYRAKDLVGWWSHPHVARIAGLELSAPTSWVPRSKPIWFVETGCPAIDRGTNAPNVFPDSKSSEARLPPFSRGFRDDLMQARFMEAVARHFDPQHPEFAEASNPVSLLYGGRMVDASRIHYWAWDARPFPAFPDVSSVWADAQDWETGHWLNGRLEGLPLDRLLNDLALPSANEGGMLGPANVDGFLDGYVIDRPMSARSAIEPLTGFFAFDAIATSGNMRFTSRAFGTPLLLGMDDLVPDRDGNLIHRTRTQESELPHEIGVTFVDADADYSSASVLSRRVEGQSSRQSQAEAAVMTNRAQAQRQADVWLEDVWTARESVQFQVRPTLAALEPGDVIDLAIADRRERFRIERITDGATRQIEARAFNAGVYDRAAPNIPRRARPRPQIAGPPHVVMLDLAVVRNNPVTLQYVAATADPWPGALAVYRSVGGLTFDRVATLAAPATIGVTLNDFASGPVAHFDRGTTLDVKFTTGAVASVSDTEAFAGRATFAIQGTDNAWEIFSATRAELIAEKTWRLSRLLRGLGGEETLAQRVVPHGAQIVLLDEAVVALSSGLSTLGATNTWRIGPANRDHGDASFVTMSATVTPKVLMPLSPVRLKARSVTGGIQIDFTRRGRIDADAWEPLDIPLGEDSAAYEITISRPSGTARVLRTPVPSALYASADMAADFPATPGTLEISVCQLSSAVGRGFAASSSVNIL